MDILKNNVDLNFLRIFEALMLERSVGRAAKRIGVSPSAVSHALAGLRTQFQDDLFVRTPSGMQPSARAIAMAENVRQALLQIELAVASTEFDALTTQKQFTIAANDHVTAAILPKIISNISAMTEGIDIVVRPSTRLDLAEQIDLGQIDLAISSFRNVPKHFVCLELLTDDEVLVTAPDHPLKNKKLKLSDLTKFPIVAVSLGGAEEGANEGFILERGLERRSEMYDREQLNHAFNELGLSVQIRLTVPHFLALPEVLINNPFIAIVPRTLATLFQRTRGLSVYEMPYKTNPSTLQAVWHSRNLKDQAHAWLREMVRDGLRKIN